MADDMLAKTSFNKQIVIYSFCMNNITQRPYYCTTDKHGNIVWRIEQKPIIKG